MNVRDCILYRFHSTYVYKNAYGALETADSTIKVSVISFTPDSTAIVSPRSENSTKIILRPGPCSPRLQDNKEGEESREANSTKITLRPAPFTPRPQDNNRGEGSREANSIPFTSRPQDNNEGEGSKKSNSTKITLRPVPFTPRPQDNDNGNEGSNEQMFPWECLPFELQEMILVEIGVSRMYFSETFSSAYLALATVCRRWRDVTRCRVFCEKVAKKFVKKGPLLKNYLQTTENVAVHGLSENSILQARSARDQLYVIEATRELVRAPPERPFVYDFEYVTKREHDETRREIHCRNRRPLKVEGLKDRVVHVLPCSRSENVYVVEGHSDHFAKPPATVHLVTLSGKALSRWNLLGPAEKIKNISVSEPLERYVLVVWQFNRVDVHDATTGVHMHSVQLSREDLNDDKMSIASAAFVDESPIARLVASYNCKIMCDDCWSWRWQEFAVADDECILLMSSDGFRLIHRDFVHSREIEIGGDVLSGDGFRQYWYDKERGLVFCSTGTPGLIALCIKE